jgi:hypothetical protein
VNVSGAGGLGGASGFNNMFGSQNDVVFGNDNMRRPSGQDFSN